MLRASIDTGFFPFNATFTDFKCIFIATSEPMRFPWITLPFFRVTDTVSPLSFCINPVSFIFLKGKGSTYKKKKKEKKLKNVKKT